MRPRFFAAVLAWLVLAAGAAAADGPSTDPAPDLSSCAGPFRCEPYLEVAAALQALPPAEAIAQLRAWAKDKIPGHNESRYDEPLQLLCLMLFESKPGQSLPRPATRAGIIAGFDAATIAALQAERKRWGTFPLVMVDDIPFDIVRPVNSPPGGATPSASDFLEQCVRQANWSPVRYAPASPAVLQKALASLEKSAPWSRPLTAGDQKFLADETGPAGPPALDHDGPQPANTSLKNDPMMDVLTKLAEPPSAPPPGASGSQAPGNPRTPSPANQPSAPNPAK